MPPRPKSKRTASLPAVVKNDKQPATRPVMLLVLGPHRSGTSLTARMLECLGAENSRNLNPPNFANPKGYFEDFDIYQFNDNILLPKLQQSWASVSSPDYSRLTRADRSRLGLQALEILRRNYTLSNPLSVLKDPRINNTLPFWLSLLEHVGFDVRFVCTVRDPVSVARSLLQRDNFSLAHGGMIYLATWLSVLPHLQERHVTFVQFDEIFATPGKVLAKVADKLGLPLPPDFDQRVHAFTSEHLDPSMRHSTLPREDVMLEPDLPPLVAELYRVLLDAAQSQNIRKTAKFAVYAERQIESLAPLLSDYDAKQARLASLQTESEAAAAECTRLQSQLDGSTQQNHAALVAERDDLVTRHTSLVTALENLQGQHSSLSTLHSSLVAERDALATRYQQLATAQEALQGQHSSLAAERDAIAQTHNQLIAERDNLATRLAALESEHSELVTRHQQLATALEELQGGHSSLLTEREALRSTHSSLIAERDALTQERDQLNAERDGLVTEREALHSERSDLVTRHTSLVTALENLQGQHSSLIAERDDLATRHQQLATALEELQGQHSSLIAERDALAARVAALESELTDGSYELQTKLLAERNSLSRTIKERDQAAGERDKLAAKLIKLEREHHAITKSEHSLKISHRNLEDRLARANAALALLKNAQDDATSLRSSLASLRAEKDKVAKDRDHLSALEAEHSDLATRHSSLVTALEQLQGQHSPLMAQGDDHVAELEKAGERIRDLEENLQDRFKELAELTKRLIAAEASQQQTAAERDNFTSRLSNLEAEHSNLATRYSSLAKEREALDADRASLVVEHKDLQQTLDARIQELATIAKRLVHAQDELSGSQLMARDFGPGGFVIHRCTVENVHDSEPHLSLDLLLEGVESPSRSLDSVKFRIVQHHAKVGFAVLTLNDEEPPLTSWVRNNQEGQQSVMLVIPQDRSGLKQLRRLSYTDLCFVITALASTERVLRCYISNDSPTEGWHPSILAPWLERAVKLRAIVQAKTKLHV